MKRLDHFEQGTDEWAKQRIGKITMSNAKLLLTGGKGVTRQNYIMDVAAELLSGEPIESVSTYDMERGTFLEAWARRAVAANLGHDIPQVGFVLANDERIGCSPDGLLNTSGLEIKCPRPRQHLRIAYKDGASDYMAQIQGCMWVCERDFWYFASFCPDVYDYPLYLERVDRDEKMVRAIADSAVRAADEAHEIANAIASRGTAEGVLGIARQAKEAWSVQWEMPDDVVI